jgi:Zn-dependent M16 (insulinase) family peptidase
MGTRKEDYVTLSQRIAKKTGGIYGAPFLSARSDSNRGETRFFLRGKCMAQQAQELLDILYDVLLNADFNNRERFRQIVLEQKAELETGLVPRGHSAVMSRLRARYNEAHWVNEQMGGVDALFFIRRLAGEIETDWDRIRTRLEKLLATLITRDRIVVNVTADEEALSDIVGRIEHFTAALPGTDGHEAPSWNPRELPASEALTAPTQVNYVGCAANLFSVGYRLHGSALVITRYLQTAWLWDKIRVQGGAYGGMCSFDQRSGAFTFASYRDPNLEKSIATYMATGAYLKQLRLGGSELTRAIIGAIGQLDSYQLPDAKGYSSCARFLLNYSDEERQKLRNEVLETKQEHFNAFGDAIDKAFTDRTVAVLCSSSSAKAANIDTITNVL